MMMRPASSSARMSRSDRIIGAMLPGVGNLDPTGERLDCLAVIDRAGGRRHPFLETLGEARDAQRSAGVEDHDVATGALLPVQDAARDVGVVRRISPRELLRLDLAEAELGWIQMRLSHRPVLDVVDGGQVGGG